MEHNEKRSCFEKQYLRLHKKLYYCALAILCNETDAAEAVREGVLTMYSGLNEKYSSKEFDIRIFAALVESADRSRRNSGFSRGEKEIKNDIPQVLKELEKIPPKERLCLALGCIAGLSAADISEITDIKAFEVKTNISEGRERLKKCGLKATRRGMLIKGLEEMFPLPEILWCGNIGEMLDKGSMVMTSAAIDAAYKDIKPISRRSNIPKAVIAAAIVLVVGGIGFRLHGKKAPEKAPQEEKKAVVKEKSTDSKLTGLRRGSYKSLHTFLSDENRKSSAAVEIPSGRYLWDSEMTGQNISEEMRVFYEGCCFYDGSSSIIPLTETRLEKDKRCERKHLELVNEDNGRVFVTGLTELYSCTLDSGKAVFGEQDLMSGTFLEKELAKEYNYNGTEPVPYMIGTVLDGGHLIAAFDFHLPQNVGEKRIMTEYCGFCIFDKESCELVYEYEQPGIMEDLIIGEDGRLTVISRYAEGRNAAKAEIYNSGDPAFLPKTYENGEGTLIAEKDIYIAVKAKSAALTIMSSFDMSDDIKCSGRTAITADPSGIMESGNDILLASYFDDQGKGGIQGHIIRIDTSEGIDIKASNYIPGGTAISFSEKPDSFSKENGIYYIADQSAAVAFDDKLEFLGEYERSVFSEELPEDEDIWTIEQNIAVFDGTTVYFGEIIDGAEYPDQDVIIAESADLSDIRSPKTKSYLNDTLNAPAVTAISGYGYDMILSDEQLLHINEVYNDDDKITTEMIKLISLRPKDTEEGTASHFRIKWTDSDDGLGQTGILEAIDEIPVKRAGTISQLEDLKLLIYYSSKFDTLKGRYVCLPMETKIVNESEEISLEEYDKLSVDEYDRVDVEFDENNNEKFIYYKSITSEQSYMLIDTNGGKLKKIFETPPVTVECRSMYDITDIDTVGFTVKDGYLYIFSANGKAEVYPIEK